MLDKNNQGRIFHIQKFSTHDGPGIRTTVFFKGCNLRCQWCHNPESYRQEKQIKYRPDKCVECGICSAVCPKGIYIKNKKRVHAKDCIACGKCVEACLYGAYECIGREINVADLMAEIQKDEAYFKNSGGGVTLSGGEPMLQIDFIEEFCKVLQSRGIHTALDTAANVPFKSFERILPNVDLVLLDLKCMQDELHKKYTSVSNQLILENAKKIFDSNVEVHVRIPLIKGVNDSIKNAKAVKEFITGYPNITEVKLLPYHTLGISKAQSIGMKMTQFKPPEQGRLQEIKKVLSSWIH